MLNEALLERFRVYGPVVTDNIARELERRTSQESREGRPRHQKATT